MLKVVQVQTTLQQYPTTMSKESPPVICDSKWGYVAIDYNNNRHEYGNRRGERADVILWPTGIKHWDWNDPECPCNDHQPGVTKEAIQFLVDKGCEVIIISKGYNGVLETSSKVLENVRASKSDLEIIHEKSARAVVKPPIPAPTTITS